jgi:putative nucleotidyltransferase with HDIG domain
MSSATNGAMTTAMRPISHDDLLAALRDLPPLPSVVLELVESLGHEELSAAQYAAKISRDQALAAKTLRLANSSFYGRGRQVHSVAEAISVLGLRTVRGVVTAAGLAGSFRRRPGFNHHAFWRHSIGSALCAQALAGELRRDDADLAFTVGLLHDIGRLALASAFAPAYAEVERWRRDQDCPDGDAERAVLGIDHAEVGGLIARQWNFAPAIVDAILEHHAPPAAGELTLTGIAHVADAVAHALGLAGDADEAVPALALPLWSACRLDDAACMRVFAHTEAQFRTLCEALLL